MYDVRGRGFLPSIYAGAKGAWSHSGARQHTERCKHRLFCDYTQVPTPSGEQHILPVITRQLAMATNKIAMKFRSITYPNHESTQSKKQRGKLQRMESFDFSQNEPTPCLKTPGNSRREVSAEGRLRVQQFQHTHSASSTLAPGQKLLRFSDECWCSTAGEHSSRPQARSMGCLTSPKAKPGSAVRLGMCSNVERLVDWQRKSPDRHSVSPNHSLDANHRHSRSKERRSDRDASNSERRSHFSTSVSLPPTSKQGSEETSTATTPTTPPVTSETRSRRSQFRRAWSLFSLTCDKEVERDRREKSPQQRILRPPTRHFYRRGLSGLPIECSSRYLGLAY